MDRLLVATTNRGKLGEIRAIMAGLPIRLLDLSDCPPVQPPEETGSTFAENARLKALYYWAASGLPTVAEDSGLEIDALGGRPGVESARYGGVETSYPEKFSQLNEELRGLSSPESPARFVCTLALVKSGNVVFEATGIVEGRISPEPRGSGGFGYDPLFYYPPYGCTLAEAGDRKALVSHRTQAFIQLRKFLEGPLSFEDSKPD